MEIVNQIIIFVFRLISNYNFLSNFVDIKFEKYYVQKTADNSYRYQLKSLQLINQICNFFIF
jgi:hypothetical protein